MDPQVYKLFGPISVTTTGLVIVLMLYKWRGDKGLSISQNAAAHKSSYFMMLVLQSITLPMLFLFLSKWLTPALELPSLFATFAGLVCLGLLVAAWIPDTRGWKSIVHGLLAYGAAILAIPLLTMLYLSPHISSLSRDMALLVLIYEMFAVTLFAVVKKVKAKHLYIQGAYIFLFAFTTIAAAYL